MVLLASPALAHETLHQVAHGKAVAVRAYESDGDPLAATPFEVYSPAEPKAPWSTGRTDGDGWLAFVPSGPGRWRVRVIEATGHGLDITVEVAPPVLAAVDDSPAKPPTARVDGTAGPATGAALVLRPLLGLGAIALFFAALFLAWRKKDRSPPR